MSNTAIMIPSLQNVWHAADWTKLWWSICEKRRVWRTLALVPAGPGPTPEIWLQIAMMLAHTGSLESKIKVNVANGLEPQVTSSASLARYESNERIVLALPPLTESAASIRVAKAADCALLCIVAGKVSRASAKAAIAKLGARNLIGSALFRLSASPPEAPDEGDAPHTD